MPAYSLAISSRISQLKEKGGKKTQQISIGQCVLTLMAIMGLSDTAKDVNAGIGCEVQYCCNFQWLLNEAVSKQ